MTTTTVAIDQENVNKVKAYIIGKGYSIGEFYAMAALFAMQGDMLNTSLSAKDLTTVKVIGKPYKPGK